jgi:hypothetical protein
MMRGFTVLGTVQDYIDVGLTHSVHTSGARSFRGCRRRWNWIFNEFYYPRTTAKPLEFGVAFHKAMEVLYDPKMWNKPEEVVLALAQKAFYDACYEQKQKYINTLTGLIDPQIEEDYQERVQLGKAMLKYHTENARRADREEQLTPVAVEQKFEIPLEINDRQIRCKCNTCWNRSMAYYEKQGLIIGDMVDEEVDNWQGLPVTYGGRIDALMMGPDGRLWIVDWKTAARLSEDTAIFLQTDDQIVRYLMAMKKAGYRVAGFIYHEQKKGVPEEPEPLTRRYKGRLYSTNKQSNYELDTFVETVRENDVEAYEDGLYDEFIDFLEKNPNRFSARFKEPRNDHELDHAWENVIQEALDMIDPKLRIYPNAGRFNCERCPFQEPCIGMNRGEDYRYTLDTLFDKKSHHYWEEAKPTTDKGGVIQGLVVENA